MNWSLLLLFTISLSPIWPLGQNPIIGDPFVIINKHDNKLAYINDGEIQGVFPIATGVTNNDTPQGEFTIIVKAINPYYRKKDIQGGSPKNPLGSRWLGLDVKGTQGRIYGIHGTNNPSSIGTYVTQGCVRMQNKDVEQLFDQLPIGTRVLIVRSEDSFEALAVHYGAMER
ncbi:L,D-transpeptidase [Cytobacillus sp. Hm23]